MGTEIVYHIGDRLTLSKGMTAQCHRVSLGLEDGAVGVVTEVLDLEGMRLYTVQFQGNAKVIEYWHAFVPVD